MDAANAEKATAMRRYHRLRFLTRLLRFLEACAALVVLSWCSARLPVAARATGELLRAAAAFLLSPSFGFLIGNAIVLVLFSKFRQRAADGDLYSADFLVPATSTATAPAAVFEDKEVCGEPEARGLRRTRSAGLRRRGKSASALRRSETMVVERKGEVKELAPEAPMSAEEAEEFRRTVEAFIARQWKFEEEESMAIVSYAALDLSETQLLNYKSR